MESFRLRMKNNKEERIVEIDRSETKEETSNKRMREEEKGDGECQRCVGSVSAELWWLFLGGPFLRSR